MKTQHVLITILLSLFTLSTFAQYPTGGKSRGYDPDGGVRGQSHYDDDDDYGSDYRNSGSHIQLALLLDASGSMNGLIDQAKAQLWNMVNELTYAYEGHGYPTIEIAVYEYGKNELGSRSGYMRQVVPFTTEFDWVAEGLYSIHTGGNQEYCGEVISRATDELRWSRRRNTIKMIYIAGNETFTQGRVDYRRAIREATSQGITVHTVFCGPYRDGIYKYWQDAAELGGGMYTNINHNSYNRGDRYQQDPYLSSLNNRLNDTYIPYGTYGQKNYLRMQQQDRNASTYGQNNLAQRTITKASPAYHTEQWDLVSAVSSGQADLASIPDGQLPANMRGMSLAQKQQFVASKQQERNKLSQEIVQIGKQRSAAVQQQAPARSNSGEATMTLDQAIIQSSKQQMKNGGTVKIQQVPQAPAPTTTHSKPTSQQTQPAPAPRVITQPERIKYPSGTSTTGSRMNTPSTTNNKLPAPASGQKAPKIKYPGNR